MTKKQLDGKWKKLESALIPYTDSPKESVEYIKELYNFYDSSVISWLAGLFDSEIGGFYYSKSARDGENFLPDIESTGQGVSLLELYGFISSYNDMPEWMRLRIAGFICSCEDPESGYFYNPQWSKAMTDKKLPRRARDTHWAIDLAEMCNFDISTPTAFSRISGGDTSSVNFLKSEERFKEYLDSLDWQNKFYSSLDIVTNIADEIVGAGYGDILKDFVNSVRDPKTGVWGSDYGLGVCGQLKCTSGALWLYNTLKVPIPDPEKVFDFALHSFDVEGDGGISFVCARWTTIKLLLKVLTEYGGKEELRLVREMVKRVVEELPRIIPITLKDLSMFKKPDGSFSWSESGSASTSHGMPVAKENSFEGDINSTLLATSVTKKLIGIITLSDEILPIFSGDVAASEFENGIKS